MKTRKEPEVITQIKASYAKYEATLSSQDEDKVSDAMYMFQADAHFNVHHLLSYVEELQDQKAVLEAQANLRKGEIYFIQSGASGFIKIGWSKDSQERRTVLQTGNPQELKILATLPAHRAAESAFHFIFQADRVKGEWFKPSPLLLSFIEQLKNNQDPPEET